MKCCCWYRFTARTRAMNHDSYMGDFPSRTEPAPDNREAALSVQRAGPGLCVGLPTGPPRPSVCLPSVCGRVVSHLLLGESELHISPVLHPHTFSWACSSSCSSPSSLWHRSGFSYDFPPRWVLGGGSSPRSCGYEETCAQCHLRCWSLQCFQDGGSWKRLGPTLCIPDRKDVLRCPFPLLSASFPPCVPRRVMLRNTSKTNFKMDCLPMFLELIILLAHYYSSSAIFTL